VSAGFVKLDCGIVDSTIWAEPDDVLRAWIALLAKCDQHGVAKVTIPAMAILCRITNQRMAEIITLFESPDQYSRNDEDEGRRIEKVEGGYRLLNYSAYRAKRDDDSRREYQREWDRENRPSGHARATVRQQSDNSQKQSDTIRHNPTQAEAEAEAEAERAKESTLRVEVAAKRGDPPPVPVDSPDSKPIVNGHTVASPMDADNGATDAAPSAKRCPYSEIVALYHEKLPMCPKVEKLTETRKGYLRQRWLDDLPTLDAWGNYFTDVAASKFLTGRCAGKDDKPPFVADLEWLARPSNFAKVAEGKYHR
jgi:hypothetical protein